MVSSGIILINNLEFARKEYLIKGVIVMKSIHNPILEGFNPDPCILKAKGIYYIVVSTFEWLPGIRVYESNDLVNWNYCTSVLINKELVNLQGNPTGCSIWAPHISYCEDTFYLVYTDVKSTKVPFKDVNNYLITSKDIKGPWSNPIYLNSSGFDPSLFHDENGEKWLANEIWDYRLNTHNKSAGIIIQKFDYEKKELIGKPYKIFDGTEYGKTEAPQIYKHKEYYYLLTAEGGTGEGHMVTVVRSKNITGPYELDPKNPMLTSRDNHNLYLKCAGHASLVETDEHEWYLAHLCTRPIMGKYPILGRETALQKVIWSKDGWLRLIQGGHSPATDVELPKGFNGIIKKKDNKFFDDFDKKDLNSEWSTLRIFPNSRWLNKLSDKSIIRITGAESPQSTFDQHIIAIRQSDINFSAETVITFNPTNHLQLAGMILYLDTMNYIYLYLSYDEEKGIIVQVMKAVKDDFSILPVKLPVTGKKVKLYIKVNGINAQFSVEDQETKEFLVKEDISFLSGGYTGNFIGLAVNNLEKKNACFADFDNFKYQPE
ncbi:glycoside hydrolase family 43 protein [Clostridium estertheticum]|uniref:glycoside hydrolase family 43 protein n=1 Tax=Clostridium estertheticum TaxID=238834 RepID=UPI001C0B5F32|nr:glycoside hydrolase family 43 protein [Clostridium estertheticum]MBU3185316.1 glycoside hydrolase family 43 protein [Clostridium estertheticum]